MTNIDLLSVLHLDIDGPSAPSLDTDSYHILQNYQAPSLHSWFANAEHLVVNFLRSLIVPS